MLVHFSVFFLGIKYVKAEHSMIVDTLSVL